MCTGAACFGEMWPGVSRCGIVCPVAAKSCQVGPGVACFGEMWPGVSRCGQVWHSEPGFGQELPFGARSIQE